MYWERFSKNGISAHRADAIRRVGVQVFVAHEKTNLRIRYIEVV